ncbi:hypothetical protein Cflav_PD5733 [Pedosphaera parvula Ellin514]|uniref:Uncharacterized protein n=1 Tax=Pedosphaera parvula (strain Ellin514) TaxID=320771 RepID=B9XAR3_PEDPL|nr:hypothetical protein Cflav_PD5733 [Pedosphaera parvula Ellin514]
MSVNIIQEILKTGILKHLFASHHLLEGFHSCVTR